MKHKIITLLIAVLFFCTPSPREYAKCNNCEHGHEKICNVTVALKSGIVPFDAEETTVDGIAFFNPVVGQIKPIVHIKYKDIVLKEKFRPQSARMEIEEAYPFYALKHFIVEKYEQMFYYEDRDFVDNRQVFLCSMKGAVMDGLQT